ncbi:hypothetical protein EVA_01565 [gut metagenome]|uniref:Uncharacterized protein n=1 Tax=gut metagenome TaxID=749906 RepID=J9GPV0_9ZZZZ
MCHLLFSVFLGYPVQHSASPVVVEVDVDIREGDTVGVQKTLKKEVVFDGVNLGNAETVGHCTTCGRSTTRTYRNVEDFAGGLDIVLHNEKVTGKTHGLHDVQFKLDALRGFFVQGFAITAIGTFVGKFGKVVSLEFDAVEFVVAAEFLDLGMGFFIAHDHIAVFVTSEFIEEVFFRQSAPVFFFCTEIFRDLKVRHDGTMVDTVGLDLVTDFASIREGFGNITEDLVHLRLGLEPFLLGVDQTVTVIEVFSGREADETVMSFTIFFVYEVYVVGADHFDAEFLSDFKDALVRLLLQRIGFAVGENGGIGHLVTLKFEVVVVTEYVLKPLGGLFGFVHVVVDDLLRDFSTDAGGTNNQPFVKLLQIFEIGTRTHIETIYPRTGHQFDEVMVAFLVFGEHNEVPARLVYLPFFQRLVSAARHIHFTTKDLLEIDDTLLFGDGLFCFSNQFFRGFPFIHRLALVVNRGDISTVMKLLEFFLGFRQGAFGLPFYFVDIIEVFLDGHHIAMVGDGHTGHAVLDGFVYQFRYGGLTIQDGIFGMDVQMGVAFHV